MLFGMSAGGGDRYEEGDIEVMSKRRERHFGREVVAYRLGWQGVHMGV